MFLLASRVQLESVAKFLVLILPLCLFTGNAVVEIIIVTVGTFFLTSCIVNKKWNWTKEPWVRAAFLLWSYFILRSFFADDIVVSLKRGLPWIRFVIFACAIAYWLTKDRLFINRIKVSFGITAAFISCNSIFQFIMGYDFLGHPYNNNGSYIRLLSFNGKMYIGNLLALISLPAIAVYYEKRKKLGPLFPILAVIPLIGVFLSGERMALIILTTCIVCFILLQKELRVKAILATFIILIISVPIIYFNKGQLERHYTAIDELTSSNSTYQRVYHIAFDLFSTNPVFGIGLKHYQPKCNDYSYNPAWLKGGESKVYYCVTHPHNIYIEILTETGLVGLAIFLTMLALWLRNFWHHRTVILEDTFALACVITLLVKYIPLFSSSSYFVAWPFASSWLLLGLILNKIRH